MWILSVGPQKINKKEKKEKKLLYSIHKTAMTWFKCSIFVSVKLIKQQKKACDETL